jgi:hypothetical protein
MVRLATRKTISVAGLAVAAVLVLAGMILTLYPGVRSGYPINVPEGVWGDGAWGLTVGAKGAVLEPGCGKDRGIVTITAPLQVDLAGRFVVSGGFSAEAGYGRRVDHTPRPVTLRGQFDGQKTLVVTIEQAGLEMDVPHVLIYGTLGGSKFCP